MRFCSLFAGGSSAVLMEVDVLQPCLWQGSWCQPGQHTHGTAHPPGGWNVAAESLLRSWQDPRLQPVHDVHEILHLWVQPHTVVSSGLVHLKAPIAAFMFVGLSLSCFWFG